MHAPDRIAEDVLAQLPDVLPHFEDDTQQEPWMHLPRAYRRDVLSEVIAPASRRAVLGPRDHALLEAMRGGASRHGAAIVRIDTALSLAATASLRGYHRPAFASQGRWPAVIHELRTE